MNQDFRKRRVVFWTLLLSLMGAANLGAATAEPASAADRLILVVDSNLDLVDADPGDGACATADGKCSLRAAIMEANATAGSDLIQLPAGTYRLTLGGAGEDLAATGDLDITEDLTISGDGADLTGVEADGSAGLQDRILDVHSSVQLDLLDLFLSGGWSANGPGGGVRNAGTLELQRCQVTSSQSGLSGGGIHSTSGATLVLDHTTVSGNHADGDGGGVHSTGFTTISTCTISTNTATGDGGGMYNAGSIEVSSSTITASSADGQGTGFYNGSGATASFKSTILTHNPVDGAGDCAGDSFISQGHNVFAEGCAGWYTAQLGDQEPNGNFALGALADNGGPTLTHPPTLNSNAIDWGGDCAGQTTDQRGFRREVNQHNWAGPGGSCDVGAVEVGYIVDTDSDESEDSIGDNLCGEVDDPDCSLRRAIQEANAMAGADVIMVPDGTYVLDITGSGEDSAATGDLDITDDLVVIGNWAASTIVDGGGATGLEDRVFHITAGIDAIIRGLTIEGGSVSGMGGGLRKEGTGGLTLERVTVSGNEATSNGGGLALGGGTVVIEETTVSGNQATDTGAGVFVDGGNVSLINCTVSGNSFPSSGGGIGVNATGSVALLHTTIADNEAAEGGGIHLDSSGTFTTRASILGNNFAFSSPDCYTASGELGSEDFNLIEDTIGCTIGGNTAHDLTGGDPGLMPLADYGGATLTYELMGTSIALDVIPDSECTIVRDQRGKLRPAGDGCEIGSVEMATDYGDAPAPYPTLLIDDGPRHENTIAVLTLGVAWDGDANGQPDATATGDDLDNVDDEDGADFDSVELVLGEAATLDVTLTDDGTPSFLNVWLDFDRNGNFESPAEQIASDLAISPVSGAQTVQVDFVVPNDAAPGTSFARVRLASVSGLLPTGSAPDGEVEDYQVQLIERPTVSIEDVTLAEGDSGLTTYSFTLTRSHNLSSALVEYQTVEGSAVDGADFVASGLTTIEFPAGGALTESIEVSVYGDTVVELDESFSVQMSNPARIDIVDSEGVGTIANDDAARISIAPENTTEGDDGITIVDFAITLDQELDTTVTIDYATADDTATTADNDYAATSGSGLLFTGSAGETQTISVNVLGDTTVELDETFAFVLSNIQASGRNVTFAGGGATEQATGAIDNDDTAHISIAGAIMAEGDSESTTFEFVVTLDAAVDSAVTMAFFTADGNASTADGDYVSTSDLDLSFAGNAGETHTVGVTVAGDSTVELDEAFTVTLTNLDTSGRAVAFAGGSSNEVANGWILNDDTAEVSILGVTMLEGAQGMTVFDFILTLDKAVDCAVTVDANTIDGTATIADNDYLETSVTGLAFVGSAGESLNIPVRVVGDTVSEQDESFTVALAGLQALGRDVTFPGGQPTVVATGTIVDDDFLFIDGFESGDTSKWSSEASPVPRQN